MKFKLSLDHDFRSHGADEWFSTDKWSVEDAVAVYCDHHGVDADSVVVRWDYQEEVGPNGSR